MPSIRLRQRGIGDTRATLTDQGLLALRTLEERQWTYLLGAYVHRYRRGAENLPWEMRNWLRQIANRARLNPKQRGATGLPNWERGMVIVPPTDWRPVLGGIVVHCERGREPSGYVPMFVDVELDPTRYIRLLVPPRST